MPRKRTAPTYIGKRCSKCGSKERYVATKSCSMCTRLHQSQQRMKRKKEAERGCSESLIEQLRIQRIWKSTQLNTQAYYSTKRHKLKS